MAITNTEVITFANDTVRPMAEKLRALKYEIDAALTKYNGGIGAVCVADMASVAEGTHLWSVKACNAWGCSAPSPFGFTKSLPTGLQNVRIEGA
jgi:hypothetical protein